MALYWTIVYALLNACFNGSASIIFKRKLLLKKINHPQEFILFLFDPIILGACFLVVISLYFSIKTLSITKLSIASPLIFSINLIVSYIAGTVFFQEKINFCGYLGLFLILLGIFFLTRK
jgi:multidrug transporter EmrE-like cation transporter